MWPLSAPPRSSCHPAMRLACPTKPPPHLSDINAVQTASMLPCLLIVVLPTDLLINSFYPKEWKDDATSQWQTFGCNANAETQQSFRALIKIMTYEIRETLKLFTNTKTKFNGCFPKNTQRHKISMLIFAHLYNVHGLVKL